jgi:COP9 signalosome complex subunit 7
MITNDRYGLVRFLFVVLFLLHLGLYVSFQMSSSAAQQYLLLAKSVRGSAAVDLITRVLDHVDIFGFDEFLRLEHLVHSLKVDQPLLLATLELFAYGTLNDYESNRSQFISLSLTARRKLQLLSLASLAAHARILPYPLLLKQLQIASVRELEDLIIDGIYAQIIRGKLDQLNNLLYIDYAIARDVNATALTHMDDVLDKWCMNCASLLLNLKCEANKANQEKKKTLDEQDRYEKEMLSMMKIIDLQGQNSMGGIRRDTHDDNRQSNTGQQLTNIFSNDIDSKQSTEKTTIRQTTKRFLRP